ncbi:MAG: hypothetical protein IKQ97_04075 [Eubacterium sp.]|nr:hypothetical protein [Eubacterium sp.]
MSEKKNRSISIILVLCMVVALIPARSEAAGNPTLSVTSVSMQTPGESQTISILNIFDEDVQYIYTVVENQMIATAYPSAPREITIQAFSEGTTDGFIKLFLWNGKNYNLRFTVQVGAGAGSPVSSFSPLITAEPVVEPTTKPTEKKTKAAKVRKKMLKLKNKYPEGTPWTDAKMYVWDRILDPSTILHACGCVAFACILSDAGFGKKTPARQVDHPKASSIRVGDILRVDDDTHSVIVLKVGASDFTIAEGNYNSSIHWGRKLPKSTPIDYKWTRWKKG